jgi:hypothetical protein
LICISHSEVLILLVSHNSCLALGTEGLSTVYGKLTEILVVAVGLKNALRIVLACPSVGQKLDRVLLERLHANVM